MKITIFSIERTTLILTENATKKQKKNQTFKKKTKNKTVENKIKLSKMKLNIKKYNKIK